MKKTNATRGVNKLFILEGTILIPSKNLKVIFTFHFETDLVQLK